MTTQLQVQKLADEICDKYKVSRIPIKVTDKKHPVGLACYFTYRIKVGRKIQKQHHPKYIMIYNWDEVKKQGRFPVLQIAHELAHHIMNVRTNSLSHTTKHDDLETAIGRYIVKKIRK